MTRRCPWCHRPPTAGSNDPTRWHPECLAEMERRRATEPPPPKGMSAYMRWLASYGVRVERVS